MRTIPQTASVLGQLWNHPSNEGHRTRQVLRALRFQLRGRLLKRRTLTPIGARSVMWAEVHQPDSSRVVYANPPEYEEMMCWKRILRPGDLFIDIGANVGSHSLWAAELGAQVEAYEPHPDARRFLERNIALNPYNIVVHGEAMSEAVGTVRMSAGLGPMNHVDAASGLLTVPATTLDAALNGRHARGVKIDVEGFERAVIAGGMTSLRERRIDYLQIEWNVQAARNFGETRAPLLALLCSVDYLLERPGGRAVSAATGEDVFAIAPTVGERLVAPDK